MTIRTIPNFNLRQIAQSGQCFRIKRNADGSCTAVHHSACVTITPLPDGRFAFDCDEAAFDTVWRPYFDLDCDYAAIGKSIKKSHLFLREAYAAAAGIRILRQDPWEMLISFIISQRKTIPAIRSAVEYLCAHYGAPIGDSGIHAFPDAATLASLPLDALQRAALGYRAPYIQKTAQMAAAQPAWAAALAALSDQDLKQALLAFPGVGEKVANCVMLYGFHRVGAFPRDVWVRRIEAAHFRGRFPTRTYPKTAGIMQQYMFYYMRLLEKKEMP